MFKTTNGERPKAVGYVRVSTIGQATDGESIGAQKEKIKAWGKLHDLEVIVYVETQSGKRADNRPELQKALEHACKLKAPLVFYSISRVSRSTRDMMTIADRLQKAGADMVSLSESIDTTSATGKMVFRLLSSLAEFERDVISERTKAVLAHKRAKGEPCGGTAPYGFRYENNRMVRDLNETHIVNTVKRLQKEGMSYRAIASELNCKGFRNRIGNTTWNLATIQRIIKAKVNKHSDAA